MNKLDNLKKGKKFQKGHPPMGGRPKNVFKKYAEQFELSKTDVKNVINYILSKDVKELETLMKAPETPAMLLAFISASISAIKKGDVKSIESMLDRAIGKVKEEVNVDIEGLQIEFVNRTKKD